MTYVHHWYKGTCPNCAPRPGDLQQHGQSVWCMSCGWARNRFNDPATGKPTAKWGLLGNPNG